MISRRNFISICVMMVTILILFQFSILVRDLANNFDENVYLPETGKTSEDAWNEQMAGDEVQTVLYIGGTDDDAARIIRQWCGYTKRRFTRLDYLSEYIPSENGGPVLLCLTGETLTTADQIDRLSAMVREGQNVLFCDMPESGFVTRQTELRALMGIRQLVQEDAELTGIKLFSGFMLGGEAIYVMEDEEAMLGQEIGLSAPWYLRLSGTKSYMVGTLEDEEIENEELPSLIWRNSYGSGRVFVINGPYMSDETGLGILSAVMYELNDYDIYPVVNAQNLSVANFPVLAAENTEALTAIYARDLYHLQSGLMWPGLIAALNKGDYKMTGFLAPQLDYGTANDLLPDELTFYLKQFREQRAEAGLSLDHLPGVSLRDKAAADQEFFDTYGTSYSYGAAYVGSGERGEFLTLEQQGIFESIRTITGVWDDADLLSYCVDNIVAQGITANGFLHLYQQDLLVRAVETSLGYSNILVDMKRISWPEEDDYHWEILAERFASNINTYWKPFSAFDKTTILESDARIRAFFAVDYSDMRRGDTVTVKIVNGGDNWFILRTHDETVSDIVGGDYVEIEEDVYLIHAEEEHLQIKLEEQEDKQYYLP